MNKRVVITGVGPVTLIGIGKNNFIDNIYNLKTNIREIPKNYEKGYEFKSRFYCPAPDLSLNKFQIPSNFEGILSDISKLSIIATKLALIDSCFDITNNDKGFKVNIKGECAVIIGVGIGNLDKALQSHIAHNFHEHHTLLKELNLSTLYNRMIIPTIMPNSASSWVSIFFGINGPNYTINASCASGTIAIGEAYNKIRTGQCITAIAGGVEALKDSSGSIMRGFDSLNTLTKSKDGNPMPFSKKRSGFLFNEGAGAVLILEELENALQRKATIYAEIDGFECNSDAYNIVQMEPTGEKVKQLIKNLIKNNEIDYINTHGTGTITNDEIEAKVIQEIFGDKKNQPILNSTKALIGHSIGASGAIEAIVTALSIYNSKIHENKISDPMENLNLALNTVEKPLNTAISLSYGFGGHNCGILFKKYKTL